MKRSVDTGLMPPSHPIEWGVVAGNILYTSQIPMKADGSRETGDITAQATQALENLKITVEAASGTMADVTQVLVYITKREDFEGMNAVYGRYFSAPYPNRATIVTSLVRPTALIELVAYAHLRKTA